MVQLLKAAQTNLAMLKVLSVLYEGTLAKETSSKTRQGQMGHIQVGLLPY